MPTETTLMKELGAFVGEQYAAILGNVTPDYNSLGKLETFVKQLDALVRGEDAGGDLDTLAEIKTFLTAHRDEILTIADKISKTDIINNLAAPDDAASQGKPLAAPQGTKLKKMIDDLTATVNEKANKADTVTKAELGTVAEFTAAFNAAITA